MSAHEGTHTDPESFNTEHLFGFEFINDRDLKRTADRILGPQPDDGWLPIVVTPNVDYVVQLNKPEFAGVGKVLRQARYVLPDGQPIVWSSRLAGSPLGARLPGSSLFPLVWSRLIHSNLPAVVVAPSREVAESLSREHAAAAMIVPPLLDPSDKLALDAVVEECVAAVVQTGAEFLIVGVGFPTQAFIAMGVLEAFESRGTRAPLSLLLGGSLGMHVGLTPRAPRWVQQVGMEWLFRFLLEPRRLFHRYFVADPLFAVLGAGEIISIRRARRTGVS